ncbi:Pyruvate dehydrogenase, E1 component, alpha subunit (acetyl-transferring) [Nitrospina gracilis 3/211]|uniref:Pyruvate dehydrogenase, E1 component, alpha subunit (Acetyl-transferring) n=1 Tax=Nitrospina gracilis (strain 3/211) TaxID=1266370 RepID=M1YVT9_NITG3|nr:MULTISPECIES: thiamine pyrophosphate-dependent dehydrogenase E1 component subunit alpha [Nitrospina]MCF8722779.1 pyruvate dehydrogenase E1 component alpha subunit [Nitrospina sp. Nb-3]CCQ89729.1 Pyruvate dehydrogenase, E1 component, alpha subunit (acetyl-transferring) [Nitrospina gracilis 3/211]
MIQKEHARDLYENLIRIRMTEEAIAEEYAQQEMRCPVHLSIGQEAAAVGVSACLEDTDVVFSTHRCHSHYLGKGGNLNAMIAELYGKQSGCAKGLGGSMHLIDQSVGMLGASAIVGGSIPLAVGAALSFKMDDKKRLAVAYFGDGACEEGVLHESLNFASLHKLPVLFVCENNFVATSSHLLARRPIDNIHEHGNVFGVPGIRVDGNDVGEVVSASQRGVARAREGLGPTLIEARTFRMMRHVGPQQDKNTGIRTETLWEEWEQKCPVRRFEDLCLKNGWLTQEDMNGIRKGIQEAIQAAFEFAKSSEDAVWV